MLLRPCCTQLTGRAVDDQRRRIQRRICDDFDFDVRSFDGADVARFVVHLLLEPGPLRILVSELHALDARQVDDGHIVIAAARAFRVDVVLQRTSHRIEPELEARIAIGGGLHRRALPVLAIVEADEHLHFTRMKAFDGRANREVAVAADGCVARRDRHATHRHRIARQLHAEQQVTTAKSPIRGARDQQRHDHCERSDSDQHAGRDAPRRHDLVGRRAFRDRDRIGREQTQQRRREALRLAPFPIEICLDATVLIREPLLENMRAMIATQATQRTPQQRCNDTYEQHYDRDAATQRDRGRELLALQSPDSQSGDREDAAHCDRRGTRIDMCAQPGAQPVQVSFESLSSAHFGVSRRIAR